MVVLHLCRKLCLRVATFLVTFCIVYYITWTSLKRDIRPPSLVRTSVGFYSDGWLFSLSCSYCTTPLRTGFGNRILTFDTKMVYTKLLLLYSLIGVGGKGMSFSPTFYPNPCPHELGPNRVLLPSWLWFKQQHYIRSQMVLLSVPKLLTLKLKPPACP